MRKLHIKKVLLVSASVLVFSTTVSIGSSFYMMNQAQAKIETVGKDEKKSKPVTMVSTKKNSKKNSEKETKYDFDSKQLEFDGKKYTYYMYVGKKIQAPKSYNVKPEDAIAAADRSIKALFGSKISNKAFIGITFAHNLENEKTDIYEIIIEDKSNSVLKKTTKEGRIYCEVDAITGIPFTIEDLDNKYQYNEDGITKKEGEYKAEEYEVLEKKCRKAAEKFLVHSGIKMNELTFIKSVPCEDKWQCSIQYFYRKGKKTINVGIYTKGEKPYRFKIVAADQEIY